VVADHDCGLYLQIKALHAMVARLRASNGMDSADV
jgi:hypothetical protein